MVICIDKIKVLVVDDSILFRDFILKALENNDGIQVVGVAADPYEARDKIIELKPDVMTCDIEMPRMDGIAFVTKLIPQYPIPVVMISSLTDRVFDALNAGAVDFVAKPGITAKKDTDIFIKEELIPKIKSAYRAKIRIAKKPPERRERVISAKPRHDRGYIIAIGASTGGTEAVYEVVKNLPADLPGIVITQHIPPKFSEMFAERLNRESIMECREAKNGDMVEPGHMYVAPGDRQMKVIKTADGYQLDCTGTYRENGHCPSVDVLFNSVAESAGSKGIGIILTGMGADGAKGLLHMKEKGAQTIGQDKKTSVVYGMPMEAYKLGAVKFQCPLDEIPRKLESLLARIR